MNRRDCHPVHKPERLVFEKATRLEQCLTWLMIPFMYLVSGTWREAPQETHVWNNRKLSGGLWQPDKTKTVKVCGSKKATKRRWLGIVPIFHLPILGGWSEYVVLSPVDYEHKWYVGWKCGDVCGVSALPIHGRVRVLRGPETCCFFAVTHTGLQIPLEKLGEGVIGQGGPYCQLPLR